MRIIEADEKEKQKWNAFVRVKRGDFLQSWEWGDFQSETGKKIWRLAATEDSGEIAAMALVIRHELPFGKNYLYCPYGPITGLNAEKQKTKILKLIFDKIEEIGKKEKSVFLKIESMATLDIPEGIKAKKSGNFQPKDTLVLSLGKTEEELLSEMKQKTRYNIKLSVKSGVCARISDKNTLDKDFEKFWALTSETTRRDGFQSHPKKYYQTMLNALKGAQKSFSDRPAARLFLAEYQGEILVANIVIFFGSRAIYLHGASSSKNRNVMAPYLLQWEQIKAARLLGCKEYDFWGIAPSSSEKKAVDPRGEKNWEGITRFKKGFGGQDVNYFGAFDIIYEPLVYGAIKIAKKIKNIFNR